MDTDVLLVTWGALVQRSIVAAHQAEQEGISVAILDLRTIMPTATGTSIAAHVQRINRVVVAHEDQLTCGFGAEIAARVAGELFEYPRCSRQASWCSGRARCVCSRSGGRDPACKQATS